MGNIWETSGKHIGNIWETYGKPETYGKHMRNSVKTNINGT